MCPKCKHGHLRETEDTAVKVEIKLALRQPGSGIRERICNYSGHRWIDQYLDEYGEPASDQLSGTTTKANTEGKEE